MKLQDHRTYKDIMRETDDGGDNPGEPRKGSADKTLRVREQRRRERERERERMGEREFREEYSCIMTMIAITIIV